jgi:hypothetical protein
MSPIRSAGRELRDLWRELTRELRDGYRPERHYMRGPGPKCRERQRSAMS